MQYFKPDKNICRRLYGIGIPATLNMALPSFIGFAVSGVSVVTAGALEAMGKGIHSLLISCMRYIVLILPLAFIFSHFFGVNGVWHAFWITEVITAVTSGLIFYRQYRAIA